MGGGEDAKWTAPQTTAQTLDEQLADPSHVQKLPQTMWACTYGIDHWMPATLAGRLTAKLVDRLTAKLVVVNLVKLHLSKLNFWQMKT